MLYTALSGGISESGGVCRGVSGRKFVLRGFCLRHQCFHPLRHPAGFPYRFLGQHGGFAPLEFRRLDRYAAETVLVQHVNNLIFADFAEIPRCGRLLPVA